MLLWPRELFVMHYWEMSKNVWTPLMLSYAFYPVNLVRSCLRMNIKKTGRSNRIMLSVVVLKCDIIQRESVAFLKRALIQ